jgi:thiamine-phosphate pyrophosphorylase
MASAAPPATALDRRPLICLVTDRRRLCSALGRSAEEWPILLERQFAGAVAGGIDLIQFRERDLGPRPALAFLAGVARTVPASLPVLVVNDRLDVALAAGAAGVHLREDSFAPTAARAISPPGFLVGRSVHASSPPESFVDTSYVIAGAAFKTQSKAETTSWLGIEGLRAIVRRADKIPVLAIGGVGVETAGPLKAAGVAGIAAIGFFLPDRLQAVEPFVQKRVTDLRRAFDSQVAAT